MLISHPESTEPTAAALISLVERYDAGDTSVTIDQYDDAIETLDEMGLA